MTLHITLRADADDWAARAHALACAWGAAAWMASAAEVEDVVRAIDVAEVLWTTRCVATWFDHLTAIVRADQLGEIKIEPAAVTLLTPPGHVALCRLHDTITLTIKDAPSDCRSAAVEVLVAAGFVDLLQ